MKAQPTSSNPDESLKATVLGGGQLAQMLSLEASRMGLSLSVLSDKKTDPAALACADWSELALQKDWLQNLSSHLKNNPSNSSVITFESEFLRVRDSDLKSDLNFAPSLKHLQLFQNRHSQKKFLMDHKIATAEFITPTLDDFNKQSLMSGFELSITTEGAKLKKKTKVTKKSSQKMDLSSFPYVLKKNFGGYDGFGTFIIRNQKDLQNFLKSRNLSEDFIAEKFIPFKKEMAASVALNASGDVAWLPLITSVQKDNKCFWVEGPSTHKQWPVLQKKITAALKKINYIGLISFEFFDTGRDLVVNEVAPRVHNSAHYSLLALNESQFVFHLKAILNLPLKTPVLLAPCFGMLNIVGSEKTHPNIPSLSFEGQLSWYHKKELKPGRKLGHINYLGTHASAIYKQAMKDHKKLQL